jgi:hypothetical protein
MMIREAKDAFSLGWLGRKSDVAAGQTALGVLYWPAVPEAQ